MTYPATNISNRAAGEFVDDDDWDELVDALNFLANRPSCRVYNSAAISCANGAETFLTFNSERWDTDSMHSTGSLTGRITINTAGLYVVTANLDIAPSATGDRYVAIRVNGATVIGYDSRRAPAVQGCLFVLSTLYRFAVADYIEVGVYQDSGGALNARAGTAYSPEFGATWIGRG